jgi:transcriptional regulator GlxA family with amidase domain
MLGRLVEVMLVEAMRQATAGRAPPGLLQGLGDARLAPALKQLHARVAHPWTVGELAMTAAMSRSAFSERFTQRVGMAPMEYLQAWRMEIAKRLLRGERMPVSAVAERVGYGSTSTFTVAFSRRVGQSPARFARVGAGPQ